MMAAACSSDLSYMYNCQRTNHNLNLILTRAGLTQALQQARSSFSIPVNIIVAQVVAKLFGHARFIYISEIATTR
jgi:hypothetical protein